MSRFLRFLAIPSPSHTMSLDTVIRRLAGRPVVEGVLLTGSTAGEQVTGESDYDLVIFLEEMPVDLHVAVTTIDGRLSDLVFYESAVLLQLLQQDEAFSPTDHVAPLLGWLRQGDVAFDRYGRLTRAQDRVKRGKVGLGDFADKEQYRYWYKVNYNLRQAERMVRSDDDVYQMALRLRLLYSLYEVWLAFGHLRGVPWQGDKAAIQWLEQEAPGFLQLMRDAMLETDLSRQVALYRELAAEALAPVGGLWQEDTTAIRLRDDEDKQRLQMGLAFWQELMGGPGG